MENKVKIGRTDFLKLKKSYSFFMIPFYYEDDFQPDSKWMPESNRLVSDEGSYLYPYIMSFLQGQLENSDENKDNLKIYGLDESHVFYKQFWRKFSVAPLLACIDEKTEETIAFTMQGSSIHGFFAPHIFLYASAKIGILTFCIRLSGEDNSIETLEQLNNKLHKLDGQKVRCVCPSFVISPNLKEDIKSIKEDELKRMRTMIEPHCPSQEFTWNIRTLIDALVPQDSPLCGWHLFIPARTHLFTFCTIENPQMDSDTEILTELVRLSKCENHKYSICSDQEQDSILKTFQNIYVASSIEGSAMMAIPQEESAGFVNAMDGEVLFRYLWIYMLAMIQRFTLFNIDRCLTSLDNIDHDAFDKILNEENSKKLWDLLKIIRRVKVNCYFTDISPFSQHNKFYHHCCRRLHVISNYEGISQKIHILNQTISHDVQELIKHNEEKTEKGQRRLNIVVGILTGFQVAEVIYSFARHSHLDIFRDYSIWWALLALIVCCFFVLCVVMNWDCIANWTRNIYRRKERKE